MDILKRIFVIIIVCGILAAIFAAGLVFFIIALCLFPILYLYQKYKMDNLWGKVAEAKKAQAEKNSSSEGKTIEAEFEVIEEVKK